jgi:hypothetical protein
MRRALVRCPALGFRSWILGTRARRLSTVIAYGSSAGIASLVIQLMKSLYEVPVPGGRTSSPGNGIPGVDGDRDGRADIHNDADSIHSAANYLTKSGVSAGAAGVRRALFAYNPVDWYVNDVLHYATRYGGGSIPVDTNNCGGGTSDPKLPSLTSERVAIALAWAKNHDGDSYRMGPRGRTRGIARALPKPPSRKLASRCPAPPLRNATGWPPATAPASGPAKKTRGSDLLGLIPWTQPDRARDDHLESSQQDHYRSTQHSWRRRTLQLRRRPEPPHLRNLARRQPRRPSLGELILLGHKTRASEVGRGVHRPAAGLPSRTETGSPRAQGSLDKGTVSGHLTGRVIWDLLMIRRLIDFRKVALLVEVGGIGDDPPPGLLAVHVVEVVPTTKNALRADRLDQRHRIVSR